MVCYFSNKKSRTRANKKMRRYNKTVLDSLLNEGDLEDGKYFKKLREVSNTYDFDSDGLPRVYSLHQPIVDWTDKNYTWGKRGKLKLTSLAEAIRNHHYKLYKNYVNK